MENFVGSEEKGEGAEEIYADLEKKAAANPKKRKERSGLKEERLRPANQEPGPWRS